MHPLTKLIMEDILSALGAIAVGTGMEKTEDEILAILQDKS